MSEFYCPLVNFNLNWNVGFDNKLDITSNVKIISKIDLPSLSIISDHITYNEKSFYENRVHYWLFLKKEDSEVEEIINIFQLVLWIIKPTEFNIRFFSNLDKDSSKPRYRNLLSRFIPIYKNFKFEYNNSDIEKLKLFFPIMIDLYKEKRFKNSIVFNYQGCITNSWETAYIHFSTTFESLLTHRSKWGVKKKLAWAYATLTETDNEKRQFAFDDFRNIYKIRSEILHGESFEDKYKNGELNLKELVKCRYMLRKLWQVILDSEEMIEKLSGSDSVRSKYFRKIANGWLPEGLNKKKRCSILYKTFSFLKKLIGCNYS